MSDRLPHLQAIRWAFAMTAAGLLAARARREHVLRTEQTKLLLAATERTHEEQARAASLAERLRIAREVHDILSHSLSGLASQLKVAQALLAERGDVEGALERIVRSRRIAAAGLCRRARRGRRAARPPGRRRTRARRWLSCACRTCATTRSRCGRGGRATCRRSSSRSTIPSCSGSPGAGTGRTPRRWRARTSPSTSAPGGTGPAPSSPAWSPATTARSSAARRSTTSRPRSARACVGYWLAPHARGRGIATRAVRLLAALGVRRPRDRAPPAHLRAGQRGLPARRRAGRVHARGRPPVAYAVQGRPPRHGRLQPACRASCRLPQIAGRGTT